MRNTKKIRVKSIAWMLCFALITTVIPFSEAKVIAAETVTNATDSGNPVYVAFDLENSSEQYSQYNATIYSGQTGSGAGFQIKEGALESATVTLTYSMGTSSAGPATGNPGENAVMRSDTTKIPVNIRITEPHPVLRMQALLWRIITRFWVRW